MANASRQRIYGMTGLRRKLKRLDKDITQELRDEIRYSLEALARTEARFMPVKTGEMRDSVEVMVSSDGFTGVVGPGARGAEILRKRTGSEFSRIARSGKAKGSVIKLRMKSKRRLMNYYKGYWQNFGTGGVPGTARGRMTPKRFAERAFDAHKSTMQQRIAANINRVLTRVAQSNG